MKNKTAKKSKLHVFKGSQDLIKEMDDFKYRPKNIKKGKNSPRCSICDRLLLVGEYNVCLSCQDEYQNEYDE